MTKVRMLTRISGSREGQDWPDIGGVIDVPKEEADQLLLNKQAALESDKDAQVEAATINSDPEVATIRTVPTADNHVVVPKSSKKSGLTTDSIKE